MRCVLVPSLLALVAGSASISALAQWTSDPSLNTPISTAANGQDLCKVAATADGGCWIAWFSSVPSPTFYNVRIQRLNAAGEAQLGADGLLVSANPSQSSTAGEWDLRTDSSGNALLTFNDIRGGSDREISAYRIAPDGSMLWGADGVQLTDNTVDEFDARICQTSDGLFTAVWSRNNSGTTPPRGLVMQRLDATGAKLLAPEGVLIAGSGVGGAGASDGPGFFQMIPSNDGSVIVSYLKDTRTFSSPRNPTIQKYDPSGVGLWNSGAAITIQANAVPIAYYMNLVSDGASGAVVTWHDTRRGALDCWVQRFDASGVAQFPAGGVATSINNTGRLHVSPTAGVVGPAGEIFVFWSERDGGQGTRGLYGQKIDSTGTRQWTDAGIEFTPFDTDIEDFMRALPLPAGQTGAVCIFKQTPTGLLADTVNALRVDGDGDVVWAPSPVIVSSVGSSKGRFPAAALSDGGLVSVWSDNRSDAGDIYAQRINLDGTLGAPPAPTCPADFNNSGAVSVQDIFDFLAAYFNNDVAADFNDSGTLSVQDIFDFLGAYFTPCP